MKHWVYVLELEHGRYYVGLSADLDHRIKQHFKGRGAVFTKLHKPLKVLEKISCGSLVQSKRLELELLRTYQSKYGKDYVRGAGFTKCR